MVRKFPLQYEEEAQQEIYEYFVEKDKEEVEELVKKYEWEMRQENEQS